ADQLPSTSYAYLNGRAIQSAPRTGLLWQPASEAVARVMGFRNILRDSVVKAGADGFQFRWRAQLLEGAISPTRSYLPEPGQALAFYVRPEYVRLIRKDRGGPDA